MLCQNWLYCLNLSTFTHIIDVLFGFPHVLSIHIEQINDAVNADLCPYRVYFDAADVFRH